MSLDLDAIRQRHLRKEQMEHRTFYEGHIVIDLAALIEEVERLRAEADRERAGVLDYLAYRIEMSHYGDAIKEFVNARHEIREGAHLTINYDEVLP
jgi:hypothetical protein